MSTSATIKEKGTWIRFGLLPFYIRPMTLGQIWEIGELVEKCDVIELEGRFNAIEEILKHSKDLRLLQKVVVKAVFRSGLLRFLLGWYIKRKTTMGVYGKVISYCAESFNAPFFFQSMTFLRGSKQATMNTREAQVHGASSEE